LRSAFLANPALSFGRFDLGFTPRLFNWTFRAPTTRLKILLDKIDEAYYILGCKCALPQKVAYGAGYTTPAKGGKNPMAAKKAKKKKR
jgi:hypothetical protein